MSKNARFYKLFGTSLAPSPSRTSRWTSRWTSLYAGIGRHQWTSRWTSRWTSQWTSQKMLKNDRFYKLFGTPRIKEEIGSRRYSPPESTIANGKCQKTTGFISLLEHRKIVANQKCQKTTGFTSFLEHRQSKMSKNDRFYKLFGTLQIKNVKKRHVLFPKQALARGVLTWFV